MANLPTRKIFIRGTEYHAIQIHSYHYGRSVEYINSLAKELKKDLGIKDEQINVAQYGGSRLAGITFCSTSVPSNTVMPKEYEEVKSFEQYK